MATLIVIRSQKITKKQLNHVFYFVHKNTLPSILEHDLLSRSKAIKNEQFKAENDISDPFVQQLRNKNVTVCKDKEEHFLPDYVPLYLQPFNHMLLARSENVCVLVISPRVLDIPGTFLSNKNAACETTRFFWPDKWYLESINAEAFSASTQVNNTFLSDTNYKQIRQAEALVPESIPARYIKRIIVRNQNSVTEINGILLRSNYELDVLMMPDLFTYSATVDLLNYPLIPKTINTRREIVHLYSIFKPQVKKLKNSSKRSIDDLLEDSNNMQTNTSSRSSDTNNDEVNSKCQKNDGITLFFESASHNASPKLQEASKENIPPIL